MCDIRVDTIRIATLLSKTIQYIVNALLLTFFDCRTRSTSLKKLFTGIVYIAAAKWQYTIFQTP